MIIFSNCLKDYTDAIRNWKRVGPKRNRKEKKEEILCGVLVNKVAWADAMVFEVHQLWLRPLQSSNSESFFFATFTLYFEFLMGSTLPY